MDEAPPNSRHAQQWIRENNLINGGLIAIGTVVVQQFLTTTPSRLNTSAMICVIGFALAIPALASVILLHQRETFHGQISTSRTVDVVKSAAQVCAIVGLVAAFWHMSWIAGTATLVGATAGLTAYTIGYSHLERRAAEAGTATAAGVPPSG